MGNKLSRKEYTKWCRLNEKEIINCLGEAFQAHIKCCDDRIRPEERLIWALDARGTIEKCLPNEMEIATVYDGSSCNDGVFGYSVNCSDGSLLVFVTFPPRKVKLYIRRVPKRWTDVYYSLRHR